MKVLTDDDPVYEGDDAAECPYCDATIAELADEVSDGDYRDDREDVASIACPSCHKTIALVRTHSYRLARFKES